MSPNLPFLLTDFIEYYIDGKPIYRYPFTEETARQVIKNQEIVNQLQHQGFSDFKTWLAEIEVMREKAEKWDSYSPTTEYVN